MEPVAAATADAAANTTIEATDISRRNEVIMGTGFPGHHANARAEASAIVRPSLTLLFSSEKTSLKSVTYYVTLPMGIRFFLAMNLTE
jgi:hypothetical protein